MPKIEKIRVPEDEVMSVPMPQWTETWHPIAHKMCVQTVLKTLQEISVPVHHKEYSMSVDGKKAYGVYVISKQGEVDQTIIWRNSINKDFSFGICGGTHAWACSNLMMVGDFVEFRRHTKNLDEEELIEIVKRGITTIIPMTERYTDWHEQLHSVKLSVNDTKSLSYEALAEKVIPRTKVDVFNDLLFGASPEYDATELFGFHGAITQIYRDTSMTGQFVMKQKRLFNFIDTRFGNQLPQVPVMTGEMGEA